MKRVLRAALWFIGLAALIAGVLGYCTPLSAMGYPAWEECSLWQKVVTHVHNLSNFYMIIGLAILAARIFLLPFLLDYKAAKKSLKTFRTVLPITAFAIPGALCMLAFSYLPIPGIILAFKTYKKARGTIVDTIATSMWNGLGNFAFIGTPRALATIRNTFLYNFGWMILGLVLAVAVAIMLSLMRNKRAVKLYQTGIFMPYYLSWVIASYLFFALLNFDKGLLGGIAGTDLYLAPQYWPFILTCANVWKYLGYNSIVYTAAIAGIDQEMNEAAILDGANTMGKIRFITLPMLKPMMIILMIMSMGRMANADFGLFYNLPMNSGPLTSTTDVFDTYVFRMLTSGRTNMGVTAAGSLFQSLLGFVLIFTSNMIVRRISPENSLF